MAQPSRRFGLLLVVSGFLVVLFYFRSSDFQAPSNEVRINDYERPKSPHVIAAALKSEDTSWIARRLPAWGRTVYVVDSRDVPRTVPVNKGREGMVYLTYIIDNYHNLPDVMAFVHGLQYQYHNDDQNHDSATVLSRLQIPYLKSQGYVNLRCVWTLGCPDEIHVNSPREGRDTEVEYRSAFLELFPKRAANNSIPEVVAASCCAQFAVTRETVLRNSRSEYKRLRNWLIKTPLRDSISGRVLEYSWHMIFGQPAVYCPNVKQCYCNVFGDCDLPNCAQDRCEGRYELPHYSSPPGDWKELPEYSGYA